MALNIHTIENQPINSNCFVIFDNEQGNQCIIIDPGTEYDLDLYSYLNENSLNPQYIILTHHHFDHIWGVARLKQLYPHVQIVCNLECSQMIVDRKKNCSLYYNQKGFVCPSADITLSKMAGHLSICNHAISFSNAPGHSSSSILIKIDNYLFTGDTLIKDEKTVLKLPTSSRDELILTLKKIATFKRYGVTVYAGHGAPFELDNYDLDKAL